MNGRKKNIINEVIIILFEKFIFQKDTSKKLVLNIYKSFINKK